MFIGVIIIMIRQLCTSQAMFDCVVGCGGGADYEYESNKVDSWKYIKLDRTLRTHLLVGVLPKLMGGLRCATIHLIPLYTYKTTLQW